MWGKVWEVLGKVRGDVGGVKKCGRVYGASKESVGKCVEVWGK